MAATPKAGSDPGPGAPSRAMRRHAETGARARARRSGSTAQAARPRTRPACRRTISANASRFRSLTTPALRDAMTGDSDRFDERADAAASTWTGSAQFSDSLKQALGAK